jgi:hypothetical protein
MFQNKGASSNNQNLQKHFAIALATITNNSTVPTIPAPCAEPEKLVADAPVTIAPILEKKKILTNNTSGQEKLQPIEKKIEKESVATISPQPLVATPTASIQSTITTQVTKPLPAQNQTNQKQPSVTVTVNGGPTVTATTPTVKEAITSTTSKTVVAVPVTKKETISPEKSKADAGVIKRKKNMIDDDDENDPDWISMNEASNKIVKKKTQSGENSANGLSSSNTSTSSSSNVTVNNKKRRRVLTVQDEDEDSEGTFNQGTSEAKTNQAKVSSAVTVSPKKKIVAADKNKVRDTFFPLLLNTKVPIEAMTVRYDLAKFLETMASSIRPKHRLQETRPGTSTGLTARVNEEVASGGVSLSKRTDNERASGSNSNNNNSNKKRVCSVGDFILK